MFGCLLSPDPDGSEGVKLWKSERERWQLTFKASLLLSWVSGLVTRKVQALLLLTDQFARRTLQYPVTTVLRMSFRSRRKSSGHGSRILSARRSSVSQSEIEQIAIEQVHSFRQWFIHSGNGMTIQKRQRLPDWLAGSLILTGPALVLNLSLRTVDNQVEPFSTSGPLAVLLLSQIQLFFLWHLPAKELVQVIGEEGGGGGQPTVLRHRATAFESCLLCCLLYLLGALLDLYPGELLFVHWPTVLASLCLLCLLLLLLLFLCLPCPEEQRSNGFSMISQLFFGRHLQPVLLNVDIKAFVTCRLALTLWAIYLLSSLFYHQRLFPGGSRPSLPLLTTCGLQLVYVLRRQWFEHLHTGLDNRNDRAGFYRLWAVLGPMLCIYPLPVTLGAQIAYQERPPLFYGLLFLVGFCVQWMNTAIDLQRHNFREKDGQLKLGDGKGPFYICAKFRRENGETGTSLLLGSGYWAHCRHPNYATEFAAFLCWTLPWTELLAYLPLLFLALLLWWRMRKDELRCSQKYGQFWTQHCQRVPHLLLPGLY